MNNPRAGLKSRQSVRIKDNMEERFWSSVDSLSSALIWMINQMEQGYSLETDNCSSGQELPHFYEMPIIVFIRVCPILDPPNLS
jgi:hypothetical protein